MRERATTLFVMTILLGLLTTNAIAVDGQRTKLEARLGATSTAEPLASGKAKFEQRGNRVRFSAECEDLVFASIVSVELNGVNVGFAVVDPFGVADLNLDTDLGSEVPTMRVGDLIEVYDSRGVGILSGRLGSK